MFQNSETINMVFILFNYKRNEINYKKVRKSYVNYNTNLPQHRLLQIVTS